jgi:hypothetical protein
MSYSVSNLFKAIAENPKQPDSKLENPDIPDFKTQASDRQFIRDQSHNALRLTSTPRNGDGFLLPRTVFNNDPRKDAFLLDGAINPDVIRQRVNPISEAAPTTDEYALYGVDKTMRESSNSVNLIRISQDQFYNYQNRFNMAPEPLPSFIPTVPTTPVGLQPLPPETPSTGKTDVGVSKLNLPYYPNIPAKKP